MAPNTGGIYNLHSNGIETDDDDDDDVDDGDDDGEDNDDVEDGRQDDEVQGGDGTKVIFAVTPVDTSAHCPHHHHH